MWLLCIPVRVIVGMSPYSCCVEAKKLRDPRGISSSNDVVSITDYDHTILLGNPKGSPSKIVIEAHYVKYMGIKVMTQHFCLSRWSFRTSCQYCKISISHMHMLNDVFLLDAAFLCFAEGCFMCACTWVCLCACTWVFWCFSNCNGRWGFCTPVLSLTLGAHAQGVQ